jgi:uncharacterized Zn finger protein
MCKHIAATLYGLGARLDNEPHHLFLLRDVDHTTLINSACTGAVLGRQAAGGLEESSLSSLFGIDIDVGDETASKAVVKKKEQPKKGGTKAAAKSSSNVKKRTVKEKQATHSPTTKGARRKKRRKVVDEAI